MQVAADVGQCFFNEFVFAESGIPVVLPETRTVQVPRHHLDGDLGYLPMVRVRGIEQRPQRQVRYLMAPLGHRVHVLAIDTDVRPGLVRGDDEGAIRAVHQDGTRNAQRLTDPG